MAKMQAARAAAKRTFARRRAEKRQAAKVARAVEREARKAAEKATRAAERTAKAAKERVRRPRGCPSRPPKREARWTDYKPGHARKVYRAIRSWEIARPSHAAIAAFFGVHINTIPKWIERHVQFERAIERGIFDRAELRAVVRQHRRVTIADLSKLNHEAKTIRGLLAKARIEVDFDHEAIETFRRSLHMRRRRGRGCVPEVDARCAIEDGALSNRQIAKALAIGESTLRLWRKENPELDRAIHDGVDAYHERLADAEHDRAWRRVAWPVTRGIEALVEEDAYERGLISDRRMPLIELASKTGPKDLLLR